MGRDHLEDMGMHVRIIKMHLKETGCKGVELTLVDEDMDTWQALVNTVMNLQDP
jgi:hypothetical protein